VAGKFARGGLSWLMFYYNTFSVLPLPLLVETAFPGFHWR
jgi:hypothetical protein